MISRLKSLQYMFMHGKKVLQANIEALKMSLSDENLALIPDYEQRIAVLKELKFIDDNSTVLLKGRVACEVRRPCSYDTLRLFTVALADQLGERTGPHRAHT